MTYRSSLTIQETSMLAYQYSNMDNAFRCMIFIKKLETKKGASIKVVTVAKSTRKLKLMQLCGDVSIGITSTLTHTTSL